MLTVLCEVGVKLRLAAEVLTGLCCGERNHFCLLLCRSLQLRCWLRLLADKWVRHGVAQFEVALLPWFQLYRALAAMLDFVII